MDQQILMINILSLLNVKVKSSTYLYFFFRL